MSNIRNLPHLGIIGGTGWPSTRIYFEEIPRRIQEELGGLNSPSITFVTRNFAQIDAWIHASDWSAIAGLFTDLTLQMKQISHIESLVILSNTLHKVAAEVVQNTGVPILHIGDCAATIAWGQFIEKTGFLGTKITMQEDFILQSFHRQGIKTFTPTVEAMDRIDGIIFKELCRDNFSDSSRDFLFFQVVEMIKRHGIEGVVLGCTELGLTMTRDHWLDFCQRNNLPDLADFPFIDAMECHIEAIIAFCCGQAK